MSTMIEDTAATPKTTAGDQPKANKKPARAKRGAPLASPRCVRRLEWIGVLSFDEFALRVSTLKLTPWNYSGLWDEQADRLLADWLQHHGIMVSDSVAAAAAETVGHDRAVHPVRDYLDSLQWDGTNRIDDWLTLYLGVAPSDYVRAVGAKWLISAVARIFKPGCKADHMLIAEGPQGSFKSSAFRTLGAPWFTDDIADLGGKFRASSRLR